MSQAQRPLHNGSIEDLAAASGAAAPRPAVTRPKKSAGLIIGVVAVVAAVILVLVILASQGARDSANALRETQRQSDAERRKTEQDLRDLQNLPQRPPR